MITDHAWRSLLLLMKCMVVAAILNFYYKPYLERSGNFAQKLKCLLLTFRMLKYVILQNSRWHQSLLLGCWFLNVPCRYCSRSEALHSIPSFVCLSVTLLNGQFYVNSNAIKRSILKLILLFLYKGRFVGVYAWLSLCPYVGVIS